MRRMTWRPFVRHLPCHVSRPFWSLRTMSEPVPYERRAGIRTPSARKPVAQLLASLATPHVHNVALYEASGELGHRAADCRKRDR
jgi:hypothetical protein